MINSSDTDWLLVLLGLGGGPYLGDGQPIVVLCPALGKHQTQHPVFIRLPDLDLRFRGQVLKLFFRCHNTSVSSVFVHSCANPPRSESTTTCARPRVLRRSFVSQRDHSVGRAQAPTPLTRWDQPDSRPRVAAPVAT